ncbi:hypothetical protein [Hyphomicrobium sp. DY-1]|uniref:hypothetical protein n=1 Tax=Hyphomicrobium sp. DY-1 TaxID=3075650 RepID=UPI0039C3F20C
MLYGNERWFVRYFEGEGGAGGAGSAGGSAEALGGAGGAGGNDTPPPFFETFTDPAVKELMKAKNYADVNALGMAYHNLNKLQNGARDVIGLPKDANDAEGWNKVHMALGRPEKSDEYTFKFGENAEIHPKMEAFAKELFFGVGASPAAAQAGVEKWQALVGEIAQEQQDAAKAENDAAVEALKTKWGSGWEQNIASGQAAVKAMGIEDATLQALDKSVGMAAVLQLFATIGKKLGVETPTIDAPGAAGGSLASMTKEQAGAEIQKLSNDKSFQDSMLDMRNPERAANVQKWTKLHEIAYPPRK